MIRVIPIRTGLIREGEDAIKTIVDNIDPSVIESGDILVVSSKPLLISKGLLEDPSKVYVSLPAKMLSQDYGIDPRVAELILRSSDRILSGTRDAVLTEVEGMLLPNAGIDRKNALGNKIAHSPVKLKGIAREIWSAVYRKFNVKVGVVISDSVVYPLRIGTRAIAIYTYGFKPIRSYVGKTDLYGYVIRFTVMALADEVASAAHLVMGEADECIPAALVKGVSVELVDEDTSEQVKLPRDKCIYRKLYE